MRLKRLRLTDLQRHEDLDLEFAPGLTIVRGPNEAGKTTIERAIEYGLFRKVTAAGQDVEGLRRWGAPEEAAPTVRIDFTDDDGVDGSLSKVFAGAKGKVELIVGAESITDPAEVERRLADLTGIPSEKFFRSTAAVRHEELADLDRDESTLRDRLQEAMSGADRGTGAARKKLADTIARYTATGAKNPGIIKSLTDTTTTLEMTLRDGEAALSRLEEERAVLSRARDALTVAEQRLEVDRVALADAERAVALKTRQDEAQARYEKYRRAAELRDEIETQDAAHPSRIPLVALRAAVERIRDLEAKISEYRAELAEEPDLSSYDVGALPTPEWRRPAIIGLVLTVVGVGLAVAGAVGTINLGPIGQIPTVVAFAIAAVGVALDVLAIVRQRRSKDVGRQNVLRNEQISRRLRGRSEIEQAMHDAEAKRAQELTNIDLPDLPAAEALLAAETEHVAGIDQLKAELRGLLAGETPSDDLARLRDVAANEAEQARHALAGMGDVGQDPQRALDRSSSAVRLGIAERERTLRESAEAEGRVKANDVDAEQVAATAEQLATSRDRLLAAERRLRVTRGTLEALDRAVEGTMKKAARYLEKRMATDVARITGGRYRRIRVDENELTFSVWSMERSDWVDVRDLSQGTLDQFYLAARLGLVRQVTRDRRPPMIFDDPFLTFDDVRAREALQLMRETATDLQVIYLTTSDRYDAVADSVIVLEAPTALDVTADEIVAATGAAASAAGTQPVAGA
ncbi:MAG TPA: AAA family ATPase [Candidatus Limnocylindrales bacterium]|jgi:uncharacterized protein YhaN